MDETIIPQDAAFRIQLPTFEGPLDLLLHLIRKHELDILDLPIAFVTARYLDYLQMMQELDLDVASEYLLMAATLAHIKSKMLLPQAPTEEAEEHEDGYIEDPRAELIRRLLEYQKYRAAAEQLGARPIVGRDVFARGIQPQEAQGPAPLAAIDLYKLLDAFGSILKRVQGRVALEVTAERITIHERMSQLSDLLRSRRSCLFEELFAGDRTRYEVVVTFLALLEMTKLRMTRVYQADPKAPIHVQYALLDADAAADGGEGEGEAVDAVGARVEGGADTPADGGAVADAAAVSSDRAVGWDSAEDPATSAVAAMSGGAVEESASSSDEVTPGAAETEASWVVEADELDSADHVSASDGGRVDWDEAEARSAAGADELDSADDVFASDVGGGVDWDEAEARSAAGADELNASDDLFASEMGGDGALGTDAAASTARFDEESGVGAVASDPVSADIEPSVEPDAAETLEIDDGIPSASSADGALGLDGDESTGFAPDAAFGLGSAATTSRVGPTEQSDVEQRSGEGAGAGAAEAGADERLALLSPSGGETLSPTAANDAESAATSAGVSSAELSSEDAKADDPPDSGEDADDREISE